MNRKQLKILLLPLVLGGCYYDYEIPYTICSKMEPAHRRGFDYEKCIERELVCIKPLVLKNNAKAGRIICVLDEK